MKFPDVESLMIQFLRPVVGVPVHTRVPRARPEKFVLLWRNGGPAANRVVDRPMVTMEAWAKDSVEASALLETCRNALHNDTLRAPLVRRVTEITGPYSIPDPDTETPRYRMSVQLTVRAAR